MGAKNSCNLTKVSAGNTVYGHIAVSPRVVSEKKKLFLNLLRGSFVNVPVMKTLALMNEGLDEICEFGVSRDEGSGGSADLLALVSSSWVCSVCGSAAMASDCCFLASSSELCSHFNRPALHSSYFLYLSTTSLRLLPSWLH